MSMETSTEHPHIIRKPGVGGGSPIIRNTRITVRHIAQMLKLGESVEEILKGYPHLQASWVHDAISYYLDHQQEVDQEIEDNKIDNVLAKLGGAIDEKGIIHYLKLDIR